MPLSEHVRNAITIVRLLIGDKLEKQFKIEMLISIDDEVAGEYTVTEVVLNAIEEAPFQVDYIELIL